MPTTRSDERSDHPDRRRARRSTAGVLAALLIALVAGCSADHGPIRSAPVGSGTATAGRDAARGISALLDRRARAVRDADRAAYDAGLGGPPATRADQAQWFDNVSQLPLAGLGYHLDPSSLVREGDAFWGTVEVTLRLRGYDATPVVTRDRYRFARTRGRFVVTSTTDRAWERRNPQARQPWDLGPVLVREGAGVLGVFDAGSASRADEVVTTVEDGIASVAPLIPLEWDRRVVVYALSSPAFLRTLDGVPGGDPLAVDGLTFPVMAGTDGTTVAGSRIVLNPRLLDVDPTARARLVRHELVHVALGPRDDDLPVWLGEGLAEYLSVRTLAPAERVVSAEALAAAEQGLTALPDDDTFNGPGSAAHYGVAWWVCEEIAETWGEQMLWTLVEELDGAGDPDRRLEELLGVSSRRLVGDAGHLMVTTYGAAATP